MTNTCSVCGKNFESYSSSPTCSTCSSIVCNDCLNIYQGQCDNCYFDSKKMNSTK